MTEVEISLIASAVACALQSGIGPYNGIRQWPTD